LFQIIKKEKDLSILSKNAIFREFKNTILDILISKTSEKIESGQENLVQNEKVGPRNFKKREKIHVARLCFHRQKYNYPFVTNSFFVFGASFDPGVKSLAIID